MSTLCVSDSNRLHSNAELVLDCTILNVNKIVESDEISKNINCMSVKLIVKRTKGRLRSELLKIWLSFTAENDTSKFTVKFKSKNVTQVNSFDKSFNINLNPVDSIEHSIKWCEIVNFKDFHFSMHFLYGNPDEMDTTNESTQVSEYLGIINEGATCYINSVLQSLFYTSEFRRIIYSIPIDTEDVNESFVFWLKYIFFKLQFGDAATTKKLIKCFDWDVMTTTDQQDIQEFLRLLLDKLDQFLIGNNLQSELRNLFVGQLETTVRCKNVDYSRTHLETFWDIQLPIDEDFNIYGAFRTYLNSRLIKE